MLNQSQKYIARLVLQISDLTETDEQIAAVLNRMRIPTASLEAWDAAQVRNFFPIAYTAVTEASPYASAPMRQYSEYLDKIVSAAMSSMELA